jgi:hypothetical protein
VGTTGLMGAAWQEGLRPMRAMRNGTRLALTLTGATALATAATTTAYACDARDARDISLATTVQASALDLRTPLNADVYHAFLDAKLDRVRTYVDALRAKVAAIPGGTVLTGAARWDAKAKLAKLTYLSRLLDAIPDSGTYAATAAEQAQVAAVEADVAAVRAKLVALLGNAPAVATPTQTRLVTKTVGVRDLRSHVCDGHWDGFRYDGTRWDGWHHDWWHH